MLAGLELSNEHLLAAVKSLSRVRDKSANRWRRIDYRNLGAEELGAIYESLLELVPDRDGPYTFVLRDAAGNDRKSTGSYYTPTSLIDCLLDSTLDPVLDDATKQAEIAATAAGTDASAAIAEALLSVTVCDPACGSGHFLVAAARRIAKRVAAVREHNPEPTLESLRTALRDVITRCIYGVDLNPMAVELAKVSLWLEALDPGKPLSFLDAHVKHGNALIGATPKLIDGGIPDARVQAHRGRRREVGAGSSPKANEKQRTGPGLACSRSRTSSGQSNDAASADGPAPGSPTAPDGSLRESTARPPPTRTGQNPRERQRQLQVADAWCAAFMWHKTKDAPPAIVNRVFRALQEGRAHAARRRQSPPRSSGCASEYGFFHWHLEFPDIFRVPDGDDADVDPDTGWAGGFTCVLGNPPWDKVDFEDKKYFSVGRAVHRRAGRAEAARRASPSGSRRTRRRARATAPRGARSRRRSCSPAVRERSRCAPRG